MKVTFLGTGTSQGVPMIGCKCAVCTSSDPRDARWRCSILVEDGVRILIDTTPELRLQMLRAGVDSIDGVIMTHEHADHIMGFDDLRRFCDISGQPVEVYCNEGTLKRLSEVYHYVFNSVKIVPGYLRMNAHVIKGSWNWGDLRITPLPVPHGAVQTMGFLFESRGEKKLAYIPDCASFPEEVSRLVENVPVLVIDGLRDRPHPTHLTVQQALEAGSRCKAQKTYITHLTHDVSHAQREAELSKSEICKNAFVAYDGLILEI